MDLAVVRKRSETRGGPAVGEGDPGIPMPRRLLLMLRVLHEMGYERLRAVTGMSPSGCSWRRR